MGFEVGYSPKKSTPLELTILFLQHKSSTHFLLTILSCKLYKLLAVQPVKNGGSLLFDYINHIKITCHSPPIFTFYLSLFNVSEVDVSYAMTSDIFDVEFKNQRGHYNVTSPSRFPGSLGPLIMHDSCDRSLILHPFDTKMLSCPPDIISKTPAKFQSKWFSDCWEKR